MEATLRSSIRRLDPETASRIAAGEVIERPISALKEVLENALDAGARGIEVRVDRALDRAFSVADDGAGIAEPELELALERHATSKIQLLEDLDRLDTLGFRGEALPSIAAVSRLRIVSRPHGAEAAGFVAVEGGTVRERGSAARAPGTTVEVADLFYNTPARRKFLGTPSGELRGAIRMLEAYALAYPEVALRLIVDERERFDWPAVARRGPEGVLDAVRERAATLWGARLASQLLAAQGERDGIRLLALLGLPEHARSTREGQVILVNRRWVQSPLLGQALRQAYGNLLPAQRYPMATLWLTVPPSRLDVNVHPTKREVRFATEDAVFSLVAASCALPLATLQPPFTVALGGTAASRWAERVREGSGEQTDFPLGRVGEAAPPAAATPGEAAGSPASAAGAQEPELWQLHRMYILAPVRGGLVIIDQHAAHERILYEEARARLEGERGASQQLLFPAVVDLSRDQYELMVEVDPWLRKLGWEATALGPPTVVVQGVPGGLRHERPGQLLQDLLDGMSESAGLDARADVVERLARSYACHAATRAGDTLTQAEMRALVDRLFATSRPHGDPHGRPTFVRLDLDELNRRFGRA
ncbi:MAG TPA: DNA mismatch repair endonuclease MutL [Candidatus Eisenbacteria bacterium]|jgi:DNA mismatch repair protein MutL